jgi:hypothetical protein
MLTGNSGQVTAPARNLPNHTPSIL